MLSEEGPIVIYPRASRSRDITAEVAALEARVASLREAIEESIPECWDTPKAERILKEALHA